MAIYKYRAKKGTEGLVEGVIEADSEKEAIEKLSGIGHIPVFIEEERPSEGHAPSDKHIPVFTVKPSGRVKFREITLFSRGLASLLKSGVHILEALNIISEQSENPHLKSILHNIHDAVKDGATLSSTLANFPRLFSPLYIAMIRTGENSGELPGALQRIAAHRAKQEEILSRFRMAMAYPILMAIVGLATVIFMFTFVIPRLMGIYTSMGQNLPLPTRILISMSEGIRHGWFWIILVLVAISLAAIGRTKTKAGRLSLSIFNLHLPILGNFILKTELSRFCRTLGLLIKSGLPILNAIDISIPVLRNEIIKNKLRQSYGDLEQGGSFGKSLKKSKLVPLFMSNLIIVGEESGRLDDALEEVASAYERDTDEAIKTFSSLLEPLMILGMGLIVGFIVVAMLLPIFEINVMAQ